MRRALLPLLLLGLGCRTPDPQSELRVTDLEGYWIVDVPLGGSNRISPAVRMTVHNLAATRPIVVKATFRRKGETQLEWGGAWTRVLVGDKSLPLGASQVVVLAGDSHYTNPGPVEGMLTNPEFVDALVDVYIQVGASPWVKFGSIEIDRRIGTRTLDASAAPAPPAS